MAAAPPAVDERTGHLLHVRDGGLGGTLRGLGATMLVPAPVAVAVAVLRGRAAWRRPAERERARSWARAVAPAAPPAAAERLARRHLVELAVQHELFWRAPAARALALEGAGHLDAALAAGRGAIVSFPHVGPFTVLPIAIGARQGRAYIGRRATHHAATVTGAEGWWMRSQRNFLEDAGVRLITRGGSFETLVALLARGETLLLAWDSRGSDRVGFLGRSVPVSSGIDRLAGRSGAPVVPALAWREGHRPRARLWPAVTPDAAGRVVPALAALAERELGPRLAQGQEELANFVAGRGRR